MRIAVACITGFGGQRLKQVFIMNYYNLCNRFMLKVKTTNMF